MSKIDTIEKLVLSSCPFLKTLYSRFHSYRIRERKLSWGDENPEKIFYIIGFGDSQGGIFWLLNKALMHLGYAVEKGYIPVIDYKNNITQYTGDGELGVVNVWEKFFKQPMGYGIDDIKHSKNIIIARRSYTPDDKHFMGNFYDNKPWIMYFRDLFHKYIQYSDNASKYLIQSESLITEGKILGVLCRGTDYITNKPKGHPIPPTPSQVIEKSKEVMKEHGCDKIFLATEDEDVYEEFKKAFGDKLIVNHQKRVSKKQLTAGKTLSYTKMQIATTGDERCVAGLEYLDAIYLLSRCNCFVGVRCGGTKGALILTEGFEYEYIFDSGIY